MAIDIVNEKLMPLRDVPAWLAKRGVKPFGKPVTIRCVQYWVQRGILEVTSRKLFGGVRYTSVEALQRMVDRASRPEKEGPETPKRERKRRERRATSSAAAGAELDAVGW